jgi:hypothetical protein
MTPGRHRTVPVVLSLPETSSYVDQRHTRPAQLRGQLSRLTSGQGPASQILAGRVGGGPVTDLYDYVTAPGGDYR